MGLGSLKFRQKYSIITLLLGIFLMSVLGSARPASAATGVNTQMNFQGRLLNSQGAVVPDGYYNIQFKIYQDGNGLSVGDTTGSPAGSLNWTETYLNNNSQGVEVKNGFLSVQLGSINPFGTSVDFNQDTLWLSMNIAGTNGTCSTFAACTPDGEMTPMKRLSANAYSLNSGLLGGIASTQFLQLAQGAQTDSSTTTSSVFINKTGSGNLLQLQAIGTDILTVNNSGDINYGANADHTLSVATAAAAMAGKSLSISGGAAGSGSSVNGGDLVLQGGASSGTGASGSVVIKSNTTNSSKAFTIKNASSANLFNVDTSSKIVSLGTGLTLPVPVFDTPTTNTTGGSIATGTTYYYGITAYNGSNETEISPIVGVTTAAVTNTNTINLAWPQSVTATGYKIYRNTSNSFTSGSLLLTNISSGSTLTYTDTGSATSAGLPPSTAYAPTTFRVDAAATNPYGSGQVSQLGSIYYNTTSGEFQCYKDAKVGGTWADCGVTNLQGAYGNGSSEATTPTIKTNAAHGTINFQDADTSTGNNVVNIRASNSVGLGQIMFGVGSTGAITIQNSADQSSAVRILNQSGQYMFNVNSTSDYVINNSTSSLQNKINNASFEAGGSITSGEEGWNGPAQASIVNSSSNAHTGNYELQVTPNTSNLKTYAGTYYEVSPGDVVSLEGWVKNASGSNGTGGIIIEGYDKDKTSTPISSASDAGTLPGTSYISKSITYTVPSNVKYVRVAAIVNSGAGTGTYYFDDFNMTSTQRGQQVFQNTADSTTAFQIQSAGAAQTLFTADTTNNAIRVGNAAGTSSNPTILVLANTSANPGALTNKNGGLFYRSDTNSLKAIIGGAVVDVCTTAVTCNGYSGSAGSTVQLQATTPGTPQTGNFNITGVGVLTQLQTQDQSSASTNSSNLLIRTGNATGATSNSGSLTLDVGTATGTTGSITIGHSGVAVTMPGSLAIQSAAGLSIGASGSSIGSIKFYNNVGSNTVSVKGPGSNPASSYTLTLPQAPGASGDCLKASSGTGDLAFGNCAAGVTVTMQDTYNYSSPATITLANAKDFTINAQETSTDPSVLFNLQCTTCSNTSGSGDGRFAVQNGGTDVLVVKPNGGGIVLNQNVQIGRAATDTTQRLLQLDSYSSNDDSGTACSSTANQGAMYYNTAMGSIRACINSSWSDLSNPDTLGLLSFGIIPSSGANPYDLPALVVGSVSGPCKVSWSDSTTVSIEACVAYSGGRRVNVTATTLRTNNASSPNANLTTTNKWTHICLDATTGQPTMTTANASPLANMPTFSITEPILCIADVTGARTNGQISGIYDTRTFTSTQKEAVNMSTAGENGILVDSGGSNGGMVPSSAGSAKLYGVIVATDGNTSSGAPNAIVSFVGPSYVKAVGGTAGQFIKTSSNGYGTTTGSIPNNSFYYSVGNTRTSYSTTCTSATTCNGSLYVNFIVR